ncbi:MAG: DUF6427 family protein [Bacteroidales bacterium]
MFLRLFKNTRPAAVVVLPLIIFLVWLPGFSDTNITSLPFDRFSAPFYRPLSHFCLSHVFLSKIIALLLFFLISILIARLNLRYFFISERTYMPAFIYLILTGGVVMLQRCSPVVFASLLLLLAIFRIFASYKYEGIAYHYFDAALMVSFSGLIYFNSVFFIFFIWIGLLLFRVPNWREWAFSVIGFLLPYLFLFGYYYFFDKDFERLFALFRNSVVAGNSIKDYIAELNVFLIVLVLVFVISSFFMVKKYDTKKVHARKFFLYFFWLFAFTVVLYFIIPSFGVEALLFIAIPVSYLISHYFVFSRPGFFTRLIFILFIMSTFWAAYQSTIMGLLK